MGPCICPRPGSRDPKCAEHGDFSEEKTRVQQLEDAIRAHRDAKGHDRCWMDDLELYKLLPEGVPQDQLALPPREEFLRGCERYYELRRQGTTPHATQGIADKVIQLEARNEVLKNVLKAIRALCRTAKREATHSQVYLLAAKVYQLTEQAKDLALAADPGICGTRYYDSDTQTHIVCQLPPGHWQTK